MEFQSTRDINAKTYSAAQVIKMGLAPDGGLFVPTEIPHLTGADIRALCSLDYAERAAEIIGKFLTDYTKEELLADCRAAYSDKSFVGGTAPLVPLGEKIEVLELWHGPTAAFKDMALQIMPRLLSRALVKTGEKRTALILVATSGDTGKAALEGYKDIDGIKIAVFYPTGGVSRVQKLQMATQTGDNVYVCGINGNFDDAQSAVKKIFSSKDMAERLDAKGYFLSSANSINWGRLVPQIAYYVSAYCDLLVAGKITDGEKIDVCVPTGNFGNIFACCIAKKMGLPVGKMICASNANNVLTDFFTTGRYNKNRNFKITMSPSMDILISSNLERLLWLVAGTEKTIAFMKKLTETGEYSVDAEMKAMLDESFVGMYADETQTAARIRETYTRYNYLSDTHTAVALECTERYLKDMGATRKIVVDSTASPYKFAADVLKSLTGDRPTDDMEALEALSDLTKTDIPYPLKDISKRKIRFTETCEKDEIEKTVEAFAK